MVKLFYETLKKFYLLLSNGAAWNSKILMTGSHGSTKEMLQVC
jgi:hypothetical protein